jgi:acetoin utilization protein AcuB
MQKDVITCMTNTLIEDAGKLLRGSNISSLPVIDNNKKLIGMITTDDVLDFFLDITGCRQNNTYRLSARLDDEKGSLSNFLTQLTNNNAYISTVVSPTHKDEMDNRRICIVRYKTDNNQYLVQALKDKNYEIEQKNYEK